MLKKHFLIISFFVFAGFQTMSQTRISAPNTLFGLGELQGNNNNSMMSIGGASEAVRDPLMINVSNPASFTAFKPTSFVFEANISGCYRKQANDYTSQSHTYGSPGSFLFGFPISKKIGASFGFQPYTKVGYKITELENTNYELTNTFTYEGNGGIDLFYAGVGYEIAKGLSVGATASTTIGSIERNGTVYPSTDSITVFGIKRETSMYPRGIMVNLGSQYEQKLSDDLTATIGVTYSPETKLNTEDVVRNVTFYQSEYALRDTITESEVKNKMVIPQKLGVGFALKDEDKWLISTSFSYQDWADYKYDGETDPHLTAQTNFGIGARFTPDKYAMKNVYKKLQYSLGFRYAENYTNIKNNPFNEFGISFGLGLPLYKRRAGTSILSIGLEKGQRGNISKNGYKENFTNFVFSIRIYENWFMKRKYD